MPPRGHATQYELITAPNAEELAQRLAEAEERHNRLGGAPAAGGPVRGRSLDKPPALSGGFDEQARGRVWRARRGPRRGSGWVGDGPGLDPEPPGRVVTPNAGTRG